jgi:hypothetical protein
MQIAKAFFWLIGLFINSRSANNMEGKKLHYMYVDARGLFFSLLNQPRGMQMQRKTERERERETGLSANPTTMRGAL